MSTSTNISILILGAGELGLPVIKHLRVLIQKQDLPISLSVLLRPSRVESISKTSSPETGSSELGDLAILKTLDLISADLAAVSLSELSAIFASYHTVVSCTGFAGGAGTQLKIAEAALRAGVKRFFPWQFGVDYDVIGRGSAQDLFDEQLDIRHMVRAQRQTDWVIVSTGMFTSFLFEPWFGVVEIPKPDDGGDGKTDVVVRALGSWENKVTVTTPEDIGRMVARVVLDEKVKNEVVYIAGDTLSFGQLADVVQDVLGRRAKKEVWGVEMLKENLAKDPGDAILKYRVVFAEGKGTSWDKGRTLNEKWNISLQDVRSWVTENLR